MANYLHALNLPTEDVLVPHDERKMVIQSLEATLQVLPIQQREKAEYLSKFVVAISIGLFDAALNYLWDETVGALRRLVASTDLSYFYDVAEKRPEYRKKLVTADDLPAIEDATLLDACARIGLLSDINRERLRHVNYMRNHASAAHPNQNDLNGAEMVGWLSNCLRYAITAKPDVSVIHTQRLLLSIREGAIPQNDFTVLKGELRRLSQGRVDDLLWTLFGMYTDDKSSAVCRANIEQLAPEAWSAATESRRYEIGTRHAEFVRRGEQSRKQLAQDFLKHVGGESYRAEDVLSAELTEKLRALYTAHQGSRNFYNEWPHAASLQASLPANGIVPKTVIFPWVLTVAKCWIGNGIGYKEGVDEKALPYYQSFVDKFGEREIAEFIKIFNIDDFTADFMTQKSDERARKLATELAQRAQDVFIKQGLDLIVAAPALKLRELKNTSAYKRVLASLPKFA